MRLEIPHEQLRRRETDASVPANSEVRRVPGNPIHRHLNSREEDNIDTRQRRLRGPQKKHEPTQEVAHERRPARSATNVIGMGLRPEEKLLLREAGRFRVVRTADLSESLYHGKARLLENDLRYLRDKGLIETRHINLRRDGRRRTIERVEVVTLTREGRSLLMKDGDLPKDQKVYAGLVKPREVEHDSQIYRAYQKEAERIEQHGGTNLRVRLDFEIKADVQKDIYAARKAVPARDMAEIKEEVAARHELPFVNGTIQIPDARIDYDLSRDPANDMDQGSRSGHQDIEVLTAAYHAGHLRSKAQAGFRNYASSADRSSLTAKIEDDSHLMENIFDL